MHRRLLRSDTRAPAQRNAIGRTEQDAADEKRTIDTMNAVAYPALQRARWLNQCLPDLDLVRDLHRLQACQEARRTHPSVKRSLPPGVRQRFLDIPSAHEAVNA